MHLLTRSTRPRTTREPIPPLTPRMAAIRLLREKIDAGEAGLDPYMPSDFLVDAHENETVWVGVCVNLCGVALTRTKRFGGDVRFRVVLEADARVELGVDKPEAAVMADEPLASRAVDGGYDFAAYGVAAAIVALERPRRVLPCGHFDTDQFDWCRGCCAAPDPEPVSLDALRAAKNAYDRRYPHGADDQLIIRTDTEGPAA